MGPLPAVTPGPAARSLATVGGRSVGPGTPRGPGEVEVGGGAVRSARRRGPTAALLPSPLLFLPLLPCRRALLSERSPAAGRAGPRRPPPAAALPQARQPPAPSRAPCGWAACLPGCRPRPTGARGTGEVQLAVVVVAEGRESLIRSFGPHPQVSVVCPQTRASQEGSRDSRGFRRKLWS